MPGKAQLNEKGSWKWYLAQNMMTEVWWMLATNFDVPGREPARTEDGYHFYNTNRLFRTSLRHGVGERTNKTASRTKVGQWQYLW